MRATAKRLLISRKTAALPRYTWPNLVAFGEAKSGQVNERHQLIAPERKHNPLSVRLKRLDQ